jgi:hypothetical protein
VKTFINAIEDERSTALRRISNKRGIAHPTFPHESDTMMDYFGWSQAFSSGTFFR